MSQTNRYIDSGYLEMAARILAPLKQRSYRCMRLKEGDRVIDVGCGPGIDTIALAEMVGSAGQVVGVDLDEAMVTEANRRAANVPLRAAIHHRVADARFFPFESEVFDAARSERLFQHLRRPVEALAEMCRVVKVAGWIVVADTDWATLSLDSSECDIERGSGSANLNSGISENSGHDARPRTVWPQEF